MQSAAPGSETTVGTDEGAPIDERHELAAQANAHQHPRARTALGIEVVSLLEVGSRLGSPGSVRLTGATHTSPLVLRNDEVTGDLDRADHKVASRFASA